ncbi:hypothetical protein [Solibacillus cecembensis]|uniref:hypothetical protein n=1 Tax=Solibacillus cecembensis TaxID=459347 RepID=UPI003CFDB999
MYFQNLKHIKEVSKLIKEAEITKLENYLNELYPNEVISIDATAFQLNLPIHLTKEILMLLAKYQYFDKQFIVKCDNPKFDSVHTYKFEKYHDLMKFVLDNNTCPSCYQDILEENTEILLLIPELSIKEVNTDE